MKARTKKLISIVLVLMMLVSMVPMGIFTVSAEGDVVEIGTAQAWADAAATGSDFAGKTVKLTADITGITAPLAATFAGTFDGADHKIYDSAVSGNGVIANTLAGGATVQNVKFENVDVSTTETNAGMIAGATTGATTITEVYINADSSVTGATVAGGLVGHLTGSSYTVNVSKVSVQASVTATGANVGGLFGAQGDYVNGIAGKSTTASATITINVTDSVAKATLDGKRTGGIIGYYTGNKTQNSCPITLKNVVAFGGTYAFGYMFYGNVVYQNLFVGAGSFATATKFTSWINGFTTNQVGVNGGRSSITVDSIKNSGHTTAPTIITMADLPTDANGYLVFDEVAVKYIASPTIEIANATEWNAMAAKNYTFYGKTIVLTGDIDAKDGELKTLSPDFKGTFNGQGYTIKNATVTGAAVIATFINTADAKVKNITFENVKFDNVTLTNSNGYAGLLVGSASGQRPSANDGPAKILAQKIIVTNSSITGSKATGGLIGYTYIYSNRVTGSSITFDKVYSEATVKSTGSHAGGFLGQDDSMGGGTVANGTHRVYVTVQNSISLSKVTDGGSSVNSAGMVGYFKGSLVSGSGVDPETNLPGIPQCGPLAEVVMQNVAFGGSAEHCFVYSKDGVASYTNLYVVDANKSLFGFAGYYSWLNEKVTKFIGVTDTSKDCGRGAIYVSELAASGMEVPTVITKEKLVNMATALSDKAGFLKLVPERLQAVAVQRSATVENGKYAIRVLGLSYLTDATDVNMKIVATLENGSTKTFDTSSEKCQGYVNGELVKAPGAVLYDTLSVYSDADIVETVAAANFGAEKIAGFTIYNIPTSAGEITFTAEISYKLNGVSYTSSTITFAFDANGELVA